MAQMTDKELEEFLRADDNKMSDEEIQKYLSNETAEEDSTLRDMAKVATKALPMAGSVVGGVVGSSAGPAGTLGGSALGAMGGRAAQTLIEENFFNEKPKSLEEKFTELPKEAAYDVAGNLVGGKVVAPVAKAVGKGLGKIASSFSGIPEQVIETYAKNYDEVNKIDDVVVEADRIRQEAQDAINQFKNIQNSKISTAIQAKQDLPVDIMPVRQSLVDAIGKLDPVVDEDQIFQLHRQIKLIDTIGVNNIDALGKQTYEVPASQAYALQKKFQDLAEYLGPGQVFKKKNFVDLSLQRAAAKTRNSLSKVVPEISESNRELSKIRNIDKNINKNLVTPEKSINSLISTGSGGNPVMQRQVEKLGNVIGQDFLSPMQNLSAAQKFSNPDLISTFSTGRAALPAIGAGAIGGAAGGGLSGAIAGGATMLATTPLGIKASIGLGRAAQNAKLTPKNISSEALQYLLPNAIMPAVQESLIERAERINQERKAAKGKQ